MTDRRRVFAPDHATHLGEARREGGSYSPVLTHADLDAAVRQFVQVEAQDGIQRPKDGIQVPDPTAPESPGAPIYGTRPCAVSSVTVQTGANGDLIWANFTIVPGLCVNNGSQFEYELKRTDDPLEAQFPIIRTSAEISIRFEGLEPNTAYQIRVRSISHGGLRSDWTTAQAFTSSIDSTIPGQVLNVVASAGLRTVVVAWTEAPETDVKNGNGSYEVQLATNSGFTTGLRTMMKSGTVTSFGDLTPATTYYVRVRAVDSSGNPSSSWSTTAGTPGPPTPATTTTATADAADISTGAVTADKIFAAAVTTAKLDADSVTAAKLATIALEVGKYIQSTTYTAGSAGWRINASGNAEFNNVTVRGTVYASAFQTSEGTAKVRMGSALTAADEIQFLGASGDTGPSIRNAEFTLGYPNSLRISAGGIVDAWATGGRGYLKLTAPNLGAGSGGIIDMQAASVSMTAAVSATSLTTATLSGGGGNIALDGGASITSGGAISVQGVGTNSLTLGNPITGTGDEVVSVGATDSGGAGYRVLRVPNS